MICYRFYKRFASRKCQVLIDFSKTQAKANLYFNFSWKINVSGNFLALRCVQQNSSRGTVMSLVKCERYCVFSCKTRYCCLVHTAGTVVDVSKTARLCHSEGFACDI